MTNKKIERFPCHLVAVEAQFEDELSSSSSPASQLKTEKKYERGRASTTHARSFSCITLLPASSSELLVEESNSKFISSRGNTNTRDMTRRTPLSSPIYYEARLSPSILSRYSDLIVQRGGIHVHVSPFRVDHATRRVIIFEEDVDDNDLIDREDFPPTNVDDIHLCTQVEKRKLELELNQTNASYEQQMTQRTMKGTKTILAVRVKAPDGDAPESVEEITAAIFGISSSTSNTHQKLPIASVVSQFHSMSHGQLLFVPAEGPGIVNGVIEISIHQNVTGARMQVEIASHLLDMTVQTLGASLSVDDIADRIIYCVPTGSLLQESDKWTAYTYLFQHQSFFQQSRCTKLSVLMHELGHSFGFRHSGMNHDEYGDETDYMGYAVNLYGLPRKAFNAHKHWLSGWFSDRAIRLDFGHDDTQHNEGGNGGPWRVQLASFVDFSHPDFLKGDAGVLIRLGSKLFLQFNEAKDYNIDSPEFARNRIVITESNGPGEESQYIGAIAVGELFKYPEYYGSAHSHDLVIEFCNHVVAPYGYAEISIHLDDGMQTSVCSNVSTAFTNSNGDWYSSDGNTVPISGVGTLELEGTNSEKNRKVVHNKMNRMNGIVWGLVALLLVLCTYFVLRLGREKRQKRRKILFQKTITFTSDNEDPIEAIIVTESRIDR